MTASIFRRSVRLTALALALSFAPPDPAPADQASAVGPVTSLPLPRYVSVKAERANARRGPGLTHRVDWEFVRRGLPLEITAEYGHWRRVRDADGLGGWVHHSLLSGVRTAVVVGDGPQRLFAGPREDSAVRAMAEPGVLARLERCEGPWCEISADGLAGWLPRSALWGVGPAEEFD